MQTLYSIANIMVLTFQIKNDGMNMGHSRYWMLDTGHWPLGTGYWIKEVFCQFYKWKKNESTQP